MLVCDDCRAASEQTWATHEDADDGVSFETWEQWAEERPPCPCCGEANEIIPTPLGPLCRDCAVREIEAPAHERTPS